MSRLRRAHERVVYENAFGRLFDDDVIWPSGRRGTHLRLRVGDGNPGVVVVPRCGDLFGVVRSFRYPIDAEQWAFPRGFAHGTDPIQTARAELHEEMGTTGRLALIGWFTPDSGIMENRIAVVIADLDNRETATIDTDEILEVAWVESDRLRALLGTAGWEDGMTMAALAVMDAASARGDLDAWRPAS